MKANREASLASVPLGSPGWFLQQRNLIKERPLVDATYTKWYDLILRDIPDPKLVKGQVLELGSGGSHLKERLPELVTSDTVPEVADKVIFAENLPFADASLRSIVMTHVFHHIPEIRKFLAEANRTLAPGGTLLMVDVAHTPLAKYLFSNFHDEDYNDKARTWEFTSTHHMEANQALTWIVFKRDIEMFKKEFPDLVLEQIRFLPWLGYTLSGGVTRADMVPKFLVPTMNVLELCLIPFAPLFSLHWYIRIRKI